MTTKDKVYYKYKYLWRRGDGDDDQSPQDRGDGTIDIITNTLLKILEDGDKSFWAVMSFITCALLLMARKRYPNEMNNGYEAKSRVIYYIVRTFSKAMAKVDVKIKQRSRPQHDMTRDPYKYLGACYEYLLSDGGTGYDDLVISAFEVVTIPLYLYRPDMWQWWRRLKKDNRKHFVKRMDWATSLATKLHFERTNKLWNE